MRVWPTNYSSKLLRQQPDHITYICPPASNTPLAHPLCHGTASCSNRQPHASCSNRPHAATLPHAATGRGLGEQAPPSSQSLPCKKVDSMYSYATQPNLRNSWRSNSAMQGLAGLHDKQGHMEHSTLRSWFAIVASIAQGPYGVLSSPVCTYYLGAHASNTAHTHTEPSGIAHMQRRAQISDTHMRAHAPWGPTCTCTRHARAPHLHKWPRTAAWMRTAATARRSLQHASAA